MTVLITDIDALQKMLLVEGQEFERFSTEHEFGNQSFEAFRKHFQANRSAFVSRNDFMHLPSGDVALYGIGGWNRYYVLLPDGALVYAKSFHSSVLSLDEIQQLGFLLF